MCVTDCIKTLICNDANPSVLEANRYFKTQEALHSCQSKEGIYSEDIGTYFQNRIRWYGKNGLRLYKSHAIQFQESSTGECSKSDTVCKELLCCDPEINYVSHVDDCAYGYGSSNALCCSI